VLDSPVSLIESTVQLEQVVKPGERVVGTGFLLSATNADGSPRTILITANHVFDAMKASEVQVGFRSATAGAGWRYTPATLKIRDDAGDALWTRHPTQDVAAITVTAPPEFAKAAIPLNYLATDDGPQERDMEPGDELLVLGYPRGLAANSAGFPILRAGRIASYPISPKTSPTFLLDFAVFPGNSGGPVFYTAGLQRTSKRPTQPFIAGILTQQVEINNEPLSIGIVTHAKYIGETVDLLYGGRRPAPIVPQAEPSPIAAQPVAQVTKPPSLWSQPAAFVRHALSTLSAGWSGALRALARQLLAWAGPERTVEPGATPSKA
jgi:hypothetical protein